MNDDNIFGDPEDWEVLGLPPSDPEQWEEDDPDDIYAAMDWQWWSWDSERRSEEPSDDSTIDDDMMLADDLPF
jgi:hypothetical protein